MADDAGSLLLLVQCHSKSNQLRVPPAFPTAPPHPIPSHPTTRTHVARLEAGLSSAVGSLAGDICFDSALISLSCTTMTMQGNLGWLAVADQPSIGRHYAMHPPSTEPALYIGMLYSARRSASRKLPWRFGHPS